MRLLSCLPNASGRRARSHESPFFFCEGIKETTSQLPLGKVGERHINTELGTAQFKHVDVTTLASSQKNLFWKSTVENVP